MPRPEVESLITQIRNELPNVKTLDGAVAKVKQTLSAIPGVDIERMADDFEEAREAMSQEYREIELLRRPEISIIRQRDSWYAGPRPGDIHWPALKEYLLGEKDWDEDDVKSINKSSTEVVSLIGNPAKRESLCRGLVVGHVQSGKTANMTAVMAKALDAGYNTIIVLAGLTNKLRRQTQMRVVEDLCNRRPLSWQKLTSSDMDGDFQTPPSGGLLSYTDKVQIAVVKKNVSPLRRLEEAITGTHPLALSKLRVLLIDDECDQASVNAAGDERNTTAINACIRKLLHLFPAMTYIGYTATPFANVFINPYRNESNDLDDLYPADFITSLPTPPNYFGAEKLFGRTLLDADSEEDDGLNMIRPVDEDEVPELQPPRRDDRFDFNPQMTTSLEDALLYFIAACAARHVRGQGHKHMTMLVHTSAYVEMHDKIDRLMRNWLDQRWDELVSGKGSLVERLEALWIEEQDKLPANITKNRRVDVREVLQKLPIVRQHLEWAVENGESDYRIEYPEDEPRTVIVTGGTILARGLTLEGLMVSFFLRSANQYDTLLQMGRWFGFRHGYEDLPRIWTTEDLALRFKSLAAIESEIREEIDRYREEELTPMELAVRVRSIPGMAITAANKMLHVHRCNISYWGTHKQTIRFYSDNEEWLHKNWRAGANLVDRLEKSGSRAEESGRKLWLDVPYNFITDFLSEYSVHDTQRDLDTDYLNAFIEGESQRLAHWNIAIIESGKGHDSRRALGSAGVVQTVNRARIGSIPHGETSDIKALMSRTDIGIDCPERLNGSLNWESIKLQRREQVGPKPLLLLYAIDRNSVPTQKDSPRLPLEAVDDVLGIGLVFPGNKQSSGNFVSVPIRELSADDVDEAEAEVLAQANAISQIESE